MKEKQTIESEMAENGHVIIPNNKSPKFLYKYTDLDGALKILTNKKFKCANPKDFNDPFDMDSNIIQDSDSVHTNVKKNLLKETGLSEDIIETALKKVDIQAQLYDTANSHPDTDSIQHMFDSSNILCMSKIYKNILMWSHYSKHHTGIVIEVDMMLANESGHFVSAAKKVEYRSEKPYYEPGNKHDYVDKIVYSKSIDWKYEQEYRVWIPQNKNRRCELFLPFPSKIISALYFGCRMTKDNTNKVLNLIKSGHELSHVQLYQMVQSKTKYSLIKKPL